ncbi:2-hydroxymuconate tautomerase family protein [Cardiobacteriaceae bacterium TAE3-ERU3]|nr:2-hydroxymuconate tautomerase family protein [Cardiobacteriaceae bacterium TAE3-ERU3]
MPVVNIKIIEGRTVEQKRAMTKAVTKAIAESIGVPESAIWISIDEMKPENFAQGGELRLDKK